MAGQTHFGGKLFKVLLLAAVLGFAWACWDKGINPLDLIKKFLPSEEPAKKEPVVARETHPAPKVAAPVAPKPEAPKPVAPPPKPEAPKTPELKTFTSLEMASLFNTLDEFLRRGRLFEAREKIAATNKLLVPGDHTGRYREYDDRIGKYYALLQETKAAGTIEMPLLTQMILKNGNKLVVRVMGEDKSHFTYETLTGIRSRQAKTDIDTSRKLDKIYSAAEVTVAFKKLCEYRGVIVEGEPGKPYTYKETPGRKLTGFQYFELADFCAANGANDKLVPLFDEALKRDAEILSTVHEIKGDRMVGVLLFFLSIDSPDAKLTLELLQKRYSDTKSYKDKVTGDNDVNMAMEMLERKLHPGEPIAKVDVRPATAPPPPRTADHPPSVGTPETPALPPAPATNTSAAPAAAPGTAGKGMPEGSSARVRDLVAKGDNYFAEATVHLLNSDPNVNPAGWADENKKALEFFMKANQEGFIPAQEEYGSGTPPQPLLDRVRETTMRSSMCRKRSVRK